MNICNICVNGFFSILPLLLDNFPLMPIFMVFILNKVSTFLLETFLSPHLLDGHRTRVKLTVSTTIITFCIEQTLLHDYTTFPIIIYRLSYYTTLILCCQYCKFQIFTQLSCAFQMLSYMARKRTLHHNSFALKYLGALLR